MQRNAVTLLLIAILVLPGVIVHAGEDCRCCVMDVANGTGAMPSELPVGPVLEGTCCCGLECPQMSTQIEIPDNLIHLPSVAEDGVTYVGLFYANDVELPNVTESLALENVRGPPIQKLPIYLLNATFLS